MNPDEVLRADAVDRAVAALLSGAHRGDILAVLPAGVGRLLDAAVALREARLDAGGPRPSFVLSLEDDLRTDLRLQVRSRSLARRGRRRALAGLAAAALLTGLMLAAGQAVPGDRLYGLKRGVEGIRAAVAATLSPAASPGGAEFTVGRRRLSEVTILVTERRRGGSALDDLLDDLLASYARGVVEAVRSEDPAAMVRARVEVQAAEVELSRFNNNALPPVDRRAVADTREALMRLLAPLEPGPTPPPSAPPPGATDAPPAPTQAPPAPEATATSTASVTATVRPLPTATATATSTYTATATQSPPLEPRRPRNPEPTDTPPPPTVTATPAVVVPPTPTADRWPTDTPPATGPGAETAVPPTPTGAGSVVTATARPPRDG